MIEKFITPEMKSLLLTIAHIFPFTLLARVLWHNRQVSEGRRRFWSVELLWEFVTSAACAVVAGGIGEYFQLTPMATAGVAIGVGWVGLRGLEAYFIRLGNRITVKGHPDENH